jgi:hypothetical protein
MRVEPDVRRAEMHSFAETGQGRANDAMTTRSEDGIDLLPLPPAAPRAVHEHECASGGILGVQQPRACRGGEQNHACQRYLPNHRIASS